LSATIAFLKGSNIFRCVFVGIAKLEV
jgi:hypothetical protein